MPQSALEILHCKKTAQLWLKCEDRHNNKFQMLQNTYIAITQYYSRETENTLTFHFPNYGRATENTLYFPLPIEGRATVNTLYFPLPIKGSTIENIISIAS